MIIYSEICYLSAAQEQPLLFEGRWENDSGTVSILVNGIHSPHKCGSKILSQ